MRRMNVQYNEKRCNTCNTWNDKTDYFLTFLHVRPGYCWLLLTHFLKNRRKIDLDDAGGTKQDSRKENS